MNNFEKFEKLVKGYLDENNIEIDYLSDLQETSKNNNGNEPDNNLYKGKNIKVIDMDKIARDGYKLIKNPNENPINTVDSFLINKNNEWFLIEFKDSEIGSKTSKLKSNILKKAYSNWYMILDILYEMKNTKFNYETFSFDNPMKFARENVTYILVCSLKKNATIYNQIKMQELIKSKYTPPFMARLKGYLFKDAYVFTEDYLERKLINKFKY